MTLICPECKRTCVTWSVAIDGYARCDLCGYSGDVGTFDTLSKSKPHSEQTAPAEEEDGA